MFYIPMWNRVLYRNRVLYNMLADIVVVKLQKTKDGLKNELSYLTVVSNERF